MALSMLALDPLFNQLEQELRNRSNWVAANTPSSDSGAVSGSSLHINCDVVEKPDRYAIIADAPGMTGDDIHVELDEGVLKVSGEKSVLRTEEGKGNKVWRQERSFKKFQRCFQLPEDAKPEDIHASLEHGVLTVEIPKVQAQKKPEPRRIQVTQGSAK